MSARVFGYRSSSGGFRSDRRSVLRTGPIVVGLTLLVGAMPAGADPSRGSTGRISGPGLPSAVTKAPAPSTRPALGVKSGGSRTPSKAKVKGSVGGLGSGARGEAVSELQTLLRQADYDISEITGTFGDQTFHAVMAFQKANGLPRTGRAGTQMIDALRSGVRPSPIMPDGGPDRIEVSLPKQYLALYRGGSLVKILSISSGTGREFCTVDPETGETGCDKAVTPAGSFRVARRVIGWRESKLGLLYNPLYFAGGIAVHGAPSVPGSPASHGCVRIPMVSADYFPTVVPDGIPVYVSDGATPLKVISSRISPTDAWLAPGTPPSDSAPTTTPMGTATATRPAGATAVTTSTLPVAPTMARPLTTAPTTIAATAPTTAPVMSTTASTTPSTTAPATATAPTAPTTTPLPTS